MEKHKVKPDSKAFHLVSFFYRSVLLLFWHSFLFHTNPELFITAAKTFDHGPHP